MTDYTTIKDRMDYSTQRIQRTELSPCTLVQDLLPLYLDQEVAADSHKLISDHLDICERCKGYLAGAQNVRAQMLREQNALRNVQLTSTPVTAIQQPVRMGAARIIALLVMMVLWGAGLIISIAGAVTGDIAAFFIGPMMVAGSTLAVMGITKRRGFVWTLMHALTALATLPLFIAPIADHAVIDQLGPMPTFLAICFMALASWGLLRQPKDGVQPTVTAASAPAATSSSTKSNRALLKAVLSVVLVGVCGLFAAIGVAMVVNDGDMLQHLVGVFFAAASALGLLEINQRRGWISELAVPAHKRQLAGWVFIASGLMSVLLLMGSESYRSVIMLTGMCLGLIGSGWWWMNRKA